MSSLALLGGRPVRERPFASWPVFDDAERTAINQVLESGVWGGSVLPSSNLRRPLPRSMTAALASQPVMEHCLLRRPSMRSASAPMMR